MDQRTFNRERLAVGALIVSTAVLCVVGAVSQFLPLPDAWQTWVEVILVLAFAALCGFSLWVANVAAACAQILAEHRDRKPWAFGIALFTAVLTGAVSVIGVDLAWLSLTGQQQAYPPTEYVVAAGFALGFVKVAMGFVIEACEKIATTEQKAEDALIGSLRSQIAELERQLKAARSQAEKPFAANDVEPSQPLPRRASPSASRSTARALRDAAMGSAAKAPQEVRETVERAPPLSVAEVEVILAEMTKSGEVISINAVRKFAGVPYSRVERSPGRHLIEAARNAA